MPTTMAETHKSLRTTGFLTFLSVSDIASPLCVPILPQEHETVQGIITPSICVSVAITCDSRDVSLSVTLSSKVSTAVISLGVSQRDKQQSKIDETL